jgi:lantibiotic modifying enzyme
MGLVKKSANGILASGIPDRRTPGFWNNVGQCCGSTGVAEFFFDLYGATKDRRYLDFARKMTDDVMAHATRDDRGTRWVHADNRAQQDNVAAETGYMNGAAGVGLWLLRLDAAQKNRTPLVRFPDSPWK